MDVIEKSKILSITDMNRMHIKEYTFIVDSAILLLSGVGWIVSHLV